MVLFEGITALDAVGPYEVLSRMPGAQVRCVAIEAGPVRNSPGSLGLVADGALEDVPQCDVVLVPGVGAPVVSGSRSGLERSARAAVPPR